MIYEHDNVVDNVEYPCNNEDLVCCNVRVKRVATKCMSTIIFIM